uniref:Uncharacterized protein n=1 Tax=Arundo donax TaxID=35708 RepID=A0A0A9IHC2_ARUDO
MLGRTSQSLSPDQYQGRNPPRQHPQMLCATAAAHACASAAWYHHCLQKRQPPPHHLGAHGKSHPPIQGRDHQTLCVKAARRWHSSNQHQDALSRQALGVCFASLQAEMQQQAPQISHHLLSLDMQRHRFQAQQHRGLDPPRSMPHQFLR